jgi:glycine/sarcosine N-methyltransferase
MADSVVRFYDELAPYYHLIFGDWKRTVLKQAEVLDRLIRLRKPAPSTLSVLDCSCGIGTQAIGLALRGYRVQATDVSPRAVERAQREATGFGVSACFAVADFRALEAHVVGSFDLVISCDNALPHLLTGEDLLLAARSMWSKLNTGGLLLVGIRDYDHLLQDKPQATMPAVYDGSDGKRVVFQVWDWLPDRPMYRVHFFILRDQQGQWQTFHQTTVYRALLRDELANVLREVGFSDVRWHMSKETGYFQPIVTALKTP